MLFEGPLSKWTNVIHGWQYRFFVLDSVQGMLTYYTVNEYFNDFNKMIFLNFSRKKIWLKEIDAVLFYYE
jgi:hypothetical protein